MRASSLWQKNKRDEIDTDVSASNQLNFAWTTWYDLSEARWKENLIFSCIHFDDKKKGKLGDDTFRIYFIFLRIMSFVLLKSETQKKTNSILLKSERVVQEEGKLFYRRNLIIWQATFPYRIYHQHHRLSPAWFLLPRKLGDAKPKTCYFHYIKNFWTSAFSTSN